MKNLDYARYSKLVQKWWLDNEIDKDKAEMHEELQELFDTNKNVFYVLIEQVRLHRDYKIANNICLMRDMSMQNINDVVDYCDMFGIYIIDYCDSSSACLKDMTKLYELKWVISGTTRIEHKDIQCSLIGFRMVRGDE
jgi:hypothetical protein